MKIVLNSDSDELSKEFVNYSPENLSKVETVLINSEKSFLEEIKKDNTDAYILEGHKKWAQKAVDFIKKINPYVPVIILIVDNNNRTWIRGAGLYLFDIGYSVRNSDIAESIIRCISSYKINFGKLQNLTSKIKKEIVFGSFYKYDPVRRNLRYKDNLIKKLSPKEGGVIEILALNFGEIVKKEIIMEKVWYKSDFYIGRSMDVYLTNLRNLFKKHSLNINIKNIPQEGLILENNENE